MFNIYQCYCKFHIMEHIQYMNYFHQKKNQENMSSIMWRSCIPNKDKDNLYRFQNQDKTLMSNQSNNLCHCRLDKNHYIEYKDHSNSGNIPANTKGIYHYYMIYNFQYIINNPQIHLTDTLIHIIYIMLKSYIISNC